MLSIKNVGRKYRFIFEKAISVDLRYNGIVRNCSWHKFSRVLDEVENKEMVFNGRQLSPLEQTKGDIHIRDEQETRDVGEVLTIIVTNVRQVD